MVTIAPESAAATAAGILARIHSDPEYPRLIDGCRRYNNDWTCTAGTLTVDRWDVDTDAEPLLEEALRALAIKAAVFEATGDEVTAEVPVARPVDEVLHAVLAQRGLTERMAARQQFTIVHHTDVEQQAPDYERGGFTDQVYEAAFGSRPPARFWVGDAEHRRRAQVIRQRLNSVGLRDMGHGHDIVFGQALSASQPVG